MKHLSLAALLVLIGCGRAQEAPPPVAPAPTTNSEVVCQQVQDHSIDLFANDWADSEGIDRRPSTRKIATAHYRHMLRVRGSLDRTMQFCVSRMTVAQIQCALEAKSVDDFGRCNLRSAE